MASWDDPTGEHPVVQTGPIDQVPPTRQPATGRPRGGLDRALTTAFVGALVVAIAVVAFIYGRSRVDNSVTTNPAVSSTAPIVVPSSTTTSTTVRRSNTTTSTTAPPTSDTLPGPTIPSVPVTSAPPTTAPPTTAPPTTAAASSDTNP